MDPPSPSVGLQELRRLDKFSPDFRILLKNVLDGENYRRCVPHLESGALVWLVDYLDEVCRPSPSATHAQVCAGPRSSRFGAPQSYIFEVSPRA